VIAEDHALSEAHILLDVFTNGEGNMSPEVAKLLLTLHFSDKQRARMIDLAERNNEGALSPSERDEMRNYAHIGTLLSILHAKARLALRDNGST
jgi:hypothetical protein